MYERTYDIIDWKSCASFSERSSSVESNNNNDTEEYDDGLVEKASAGSNSEIVFPTLFHEDVETGTSIVTFPDYESEFWPSGIYVGVPDDIEQLSVYQKVANWVTTQKAYFRKEEEHVIEDDDLEVIDPVDLFHESILDEYLLIAEDDLERRVILRGLTDHRYDIEAVQELMRTHEYKFIRQPNADVELELQDIVDFGNPRVKEKVTSRKSRNRLSTYNSLSPEEVEENILFLGVPRLLDNYVVLDREGSDIKIDEIPDLWLSPFEEDLNKNNTSDEDNHSELEFLSSWFSDVYQTDINTDERRQTITDILEKLTVISVGSDDEVWLDAPEIPHWLDEEPEELELFNQPSRPLYYYRDRIKGCYRIIGVEDETVVLFSGNDDDTIFYSQENPPFNQSRPSTNENECDSDRVPNEGIITKTMHSSSMPSGYSRTSFVSKYRRMYNRLRYGEKREANDAKADSGIDEDIDEATCDDVAMSPFSLPSEESFRVVVKSGQRPPFAINPKKESFAECLFVVMGACIVLITLVMYKNDRPLFQMYRSRITEEVFDDIHMIMSRVFK